MLDKLLNLLFPPKCELCDTLGDYICTKCYKELKKYELENNEKGKFFLYRYEEQIRKMLIKYKFNGSGYLCNLFSTCILNNKDACKFINNYNLIIPVPLHRKRRNERRYNQSELIVKKVVKELQENVSIREFQKDREPNINGNNLRNIIKLDTKSLIKIKNTKPQSTLKLPDRTKSVKGAYKVIDVEAIKGKKVLVFDDIYTMGNTYNESKKVLLEAGAKEVGIFTLARDFMK